MPITSPVERISGPSSESAPSKRSKGKHGLLDRDVLAEADAFVPARQGELGDALAEHDATGELGQGQADRLGDERDGARGARVGLDHIQAAIMDRVLRVHQAHDADAERDVARGGADLLEHLLP